MKQNLSHGAPLSMGCLSLRLVSAGAHIRCCAITEGTVKRWQGTARNGRPKQFPAQCKVAFLFIKASLLPFVLNFMLDDLPLAIKSDA